MRKYFALCVVMLSVVYMTVACGGITHQAGDTKDETNTVCQNNEEDYSGIISDEEELSIEPTQTESVSISEPDISDSHPTEICPSESAPTEPMPSEATSATEPDTTAPQSTEIPPSESVPTEPMPTEATSATEPDTVEPQPTENAPIEPNSPSPEQPDDSAGGNHETGEDEF